MDEREKALPKWAQELITRLRSVIEEKNGPLLRELENLRPKVDLLKRENGALREMLEYAGRGGHPTSSLITQIINSHGLELTKE